MQRDLTFTIAKLLDLLLRDLFSSVVRLTYHGTLIRTGITRRKIPFYVRESACWWFIVKKPKLF